VDKHTTSGPAARFDDGNQTLHPHGFRRGLHSAPSAILTVVERSQLLAAACRRYGLTAVYLFGSRAADGKRTLDGDDVSAAGSDLDVGIVFADPSFDSTE